MKIIQIVLACVAVFFGLLTMIAGISVIMGLSPGYIVFRPLLIYNTIMGVVYVAAGIAIWNNSKHGVNSAAFIFFLNLVVLAVIYFFYLKGSLIAVDSLRAMSLRTIVWLALFGGLVWLNHKNKHCNIKSGCM